MRIGLHDSDNTGFPNLALMKISQYFKSRGDTVEWWMPMEIYDKVFSSKIFTFTPENPYLPENTVRGGGLDMACTMNFHRRSTPCFQTTASIRKLDTRLGS